MLNSINIVKIKSFIESEIIKLKSLKDNNSILSQTHYNVGMSTLLHKYQDFKLFWSIPLFKNYSLDRYLSKFTLNNMTRIR